MTTASDPLAPLIEGITFRFIQPQTRLPKGYGGCRKLFADLGVHLDVLNSRLPGTDRGWQRRLRGLCKIPRMSTIAVGALINRAVTLMSGRNCYLNIGVWNGFTFLSGVAGNPGKTCIGVDNFCKFGGPRNAFLRRFDACRSPAHQFHDMDYLDYCATKHREPIGVYLYDDPHTHADQLKGLQVAEPFFSGECLILVDDTNGDAARRGTLDFIAQSGNRYEMLLDRRTSRNGHPTFWNGLMIFRRVG
jgi:hypothetical protein